MEKYLDNEDERLRDNFKMQYIHSCNTCKTRFECTLTNSKIITCDRYWADLNYNK